MMMTMTTNTPRLLRAAEPVCAQAGLGAPGARPGGVVRWTSAQLLQGQRQAELEHAGQVYRLSLTAQGKLILTK